MRAINTKKKMNKIYHLICISLLLFTVACNDDKFEDVNTNINEITTIKPIYLINGSIGSLFNDNGTWYNLQDVVHHFAGTGRASAEYNRFHASAWGRVYGSALNLNDVINYTKDKEEEVNKKVYGLALIFKAYAFQKLTDLYGDIPYSEASIPKDGNIEKPKYDTQKSIYLSCFENIKKGLEILEPYENLAMGSADRVYGGDLKKWKKFANSLRLRMAMRLRFADPKIAAEQITEALKHDLIESNDEECNFTNFDEDGYKHPSYSELKVGNRTNTSKLLIDYLKSTGDLRLKTFALPVTTGANKGKFEGLPNGYMPGLTIDNFSFAGRVTYQPDLPLQNLGYSEVCFLKAEAYLAGLGVTKDAAKADEWFKKGIKASLAFWDREDKYLDENKKEVKVRHYDDAAVTAFLASPTATLTGTDEQKLEQISMQKWISTMNNAYETFAEMRRTGYPQIAKRGSNLEQGETNGVWPRRMTYPEGEALLNTENFKKAAAATNNNSMTHKVWWDIR